METDRLFNQFLIKLSEFEELSRNVGYYNAMANVGRDEVDITEYEKLRSKQLKMFVELTEMFPKQ